MEIRERKVGHVKRRRAVHINCDILAVIDTCPFKHGCIADLSAAELRRAEEQLAWKAACIHSRELDDFDTVKARIKEIITL